MKTALTLLIVVTLTASGRAGTSAVLRGIRIVETQDQLHPPRGKLGERGPYQFRRSTWRMHTQSSFDLAENREVSNTVARRHYAWIQTQLEANGVAPSPYNIALAWNAGVNAVIRGSAPAVAHDYASRVLNIAAEIARNESPTPAPEPVQAPTVAAMAVPENRNVLIDPNSSANADVSPITVATPVASTVTVGREDPVEVRYYDNPIILAFHKPVAPQLDSEKSRTPGMFDMTAHALAAAEQIPPAIARM
ncbi:MAG: hypothetical protein QM790_07380 [Nibricoccus sp.]